MANYKKYEQDQSFFIPINIDVNFPERSYVRFLNDCIETNISTEVFDDKRKNDNVGELAKHPKMMLKVIFYAFSLGIYSMRKISSHYLPYSIDFIYLSGYQTVSHSTLSRFVNLYKEEITDIFLKILFIAREMGFVNGNLIAIDGCKVKANASRSLSGNYKKFKQKKKLYEKMIKNLLERASRLDKKENSIEVDNKEKEKIKRLEKSYNNRIAQLNKVLEECEKNEEKKEDKKQINLTDPDSAMMKKGNEVFQGYNCQAMVNNEGLIVASEIVNNCSDRDQAVPMVQATANALKEIGIDEKEIKSINYLMDKGYNDSASIGYLMDENYNIYIPFQSHETDLLNVNTIKNYHCKLSKENEVCRLECPGGQVLVGIRTNYASASPFYKFTANKERCMNCPFAEKCANKTKKNKWFSVKATIFDNFENINELRKKMENKYELDIYHKRMGIVEPVFGTITHHRNFKQFLVRGIEKVKLQWSMVCAAFNLKRLWKLSMNT